MNPITFLRASGFLSSRNFSLSEVPPLTDQVAVVTGGQAGIGREITAQLLLHGVAKVYVLARSERKFVDARKDWSNRQGLEAGDVQQRTEFLQCDLSDIRATAHAARTLLEKTDRLDMVFNNAALPPQKAYDLSPDGVDMIFAANHLGHYVLTNILLPLLEQTSMAYGTARVIVASSSIHMLCRELRLDALASPTPSKRPAAYDGWWRYGRSKLACILLARYLSKLEQDRGFQGVYVNCYFPGNIATDAMDAWKDMLGSVAGRLPKQLFRLVGQSLEDGATTALYLASSPEVQENDLRGRYFLPIAAEGRPSRLARDGGLANNLWCWSDRKVADVLGEGWQGAGGREKN